VLTVGEESHYGKLPGEHIILLGPAADCQLQKFSAPGCSGALFLTRVSRATFADLREMSLSFPGEHITSPGPEADLHLQKLTTPDSFCNTRTVPFCNFLFISTSYRHFHGHSIYLAYFA
jgi:hypothetical protein